MAEILNFPNKNIAREDISQTRAALETLTSGNDFNALNAMMALLDLKDEEFELVAPGVIQSFQQSINNPNDKIALVQALNATGGKVEDLIISFNEIADNIDLMEISQLKKDFLKEFLASIINAINETEGISKRLIQIPIELCHEDAKIPQYANISDSGMDVYALDDYTINPGETKLIPTGIKLAIPPGYEIQVRPKSGRALKTKIRIPNTPGTIKVA